MSLQKARQLEKARAHFQSLMASSPNINGLGNLNRSYKSTLLLSPPVPSPVSRYPRIDRSQIIAKRIIEIRRRSTTTHPLCFKCGDGGHRARECRNALICFFCNKTGHKSDTCHSEASISQIGVEQSASQSDTSPMAPPGFRRGQARARYQPFNNRPPRPPAGQQPPPFPHPDHGFPHIQPPMHDRSFVHQRPSLQALRPPFPPQATSGPVMIQTPPDRPVTRAPPPPPPPLVVATPVPPADPLPQPPRQIRAPVLMFNSTHESEAINREL